jgi:hypothetical protein
METLRHGETNARRAPGDEGAQARKLLHVALGVSLRVTLRHRYSLQFLRMHS